MCVGSWIYNEDQEDYEPCIVVLPRYRRNGFKPCVVALSSAWKYNPEHGGPAYLARASQIFLKELGMDDCMSNAYKVAEIIQNNLRDLIMMPPNPTRAVVMADATIKVGGIKRAIEIVEHLPLAQA